MTVGARRQDGWGSRFAPNRAVRFGVVALVFMVFVVFTWRTSLIERTRKTIAWRPIHSNPRPSTTAGSKIIVVGKQSTDNTDWIAEELPDWQHAIYTVNNVSEPLHTIKNKGHEATPYLTFIIDNYDDLPETMLFMHSHKNGAGSAWHVDYGNHSNPKSAQDLRLDYIQREGYANLRCIPWPGCPDAVQPFRNRTSEDKGHEIEIFMLEAWKFIFPDVPIPNVLATACCAQFAVSRTQVLKREKAVYARVLEWVLQTSLKDSESGRVMEFLWHILFGKEPVHCPDMNECRCNLYGLGCKT